MTRKPNDIAYCWPLSNFDDSNELLTKSLLSTSMLNKSLKFVYTALSNIRQRDGYLDAIHEVFPLLIPMLDQKAKLLALDIFTSYYEHTHPELIQRLVEEDEFSLENVAKIRLYDTSLKAKTMNVLSTELMKILAMNYQIWIKKNKNSKTMFYEKKLVELQKSFRLTKLETLTIELRLYLKCSSELTDFVYSCISQHRELKLTIANFFPEYTFDEVSDVLSSDKMKKLGIINQRDQLDAGIQIYLCSRKKTSISAIYFSKIKKSSISLDNLIDRQEITAIEGLLANRVKGKGLNILFMGPPGTGKTETVKAISKKFKLCTYQINSLKAGEDQDLTNFRIQGLAVCKSLIEDHNDCAILIDEAENMINTNQNSFSSSGIHLGQKARINEIMDDTTHLQIWILNYDNELDASTRRRFDYIIEFPRANLSKRIAIWNTLTKKYKIRRTINNKTIHNYANQYNVEAGMIDLALKNVCNLKQKNWSKTRIIKQIEVLLSNYNGFGNRHSSVQQQVEVELPFTTLNISPKLPWKNLQMALESIKTNDGVKVQTSLKILLSGAPGTGKTFLAKQISRLLDRPLEIYTPSKILGSYVGENEKNIARAFQLASKTGAILFFDEIDAILSDRKGARQRWERSTVNEFLINLENFNGIFIAATNYQEILDLASLRRFNFKLNFGYLKPEVLPEFFKQYFTIKLPNSFSEALKSIIDLTPSDFSTVKQQLHWNQSQNTSIQEILEALIAERDARLPTSKQHAIGFIPS